MMHDQVFARALQLAGELDGQQKDVLEIFCASCAAALEARLKEGVRVEDCQEEFFTAAGLYALGAMERLRGEVSEFRAGDLTLKQQASGGTEGRASGMERQAEALMRPFLKGSFVFVGV